MAPLAPGVLRERVDLYLKLIEYKRSVGTTQWTILSVFVTASEAAFAYGLTQKETTSRSVLAMALAIYWFGLLLYCRYRNFNRHVSTYLVQLEAGIGCDFQSYLNQRAHTEGTLSTLRILVYAGILYSAVGLVLMVLGQTG